MSKPVIHPRALLLAAAMLLPCSQAWTAPIAGRAPVPVVAQTVSIEDVSTFEGAPHGSNMLTFRVSVGVPATSTVTFTAATSAGTATPDTDYAAIPPTQYTIYPGQVSVAVNVPVFGDDAIEPDETVLLDISNVTGASAPDPQAIGTIRNDDDGLPAPELSIGDVSVVESSSGISQAVFTIKLSHVALTDVSYHVETLVDGNTAELGVDYEYASEDQTIPAGELGKTFSVPVHGDTDDELNEIFNVGLTSPSGAIFADASAIGTIVDDDVTVTPPTLSIADLRYFEENSGGSGWRFTATLSATTSVPVSFDIATANGSATAGSDYVASTQTVVIPPGARSAGFEVIVNGDATVEPDETFVVNASNLVNASVGDGSATGTIRNDDFSGPTLSIRDEAVSEGDAGTKLLTFTVELSSAQAGTVSFNIATANDTAVAGSDYVAKSQTGVSMAPGEISKNFSVTINGDTSPEYDETFLIKLSNPVGASLLFDQAVGTIGNDDGSPAPGGPNLLVHDASTTEGNSGTKALHFVVELSQAASVPITLTYTTTVGGTAKSDDYVGVTSATLQIPADTTSAGFDILLKGDAVAEPNEYFFVTLVNATNATIVNPLQPVGPVAKGWINNDDAAAISAARIDARGLYDDLDDGRNEPVLSQQEYALLLLDVAKQVCERAEAATVVGVDRVESLVVLRELADTANRLCQGKPRYQAVMAKTKGEGTGYLVESTDARDVRGVEVLGKPQVDATAKLSRLSVQGSGHAGPTTVLLPQGLSTRPVERAAQLKALGQRVQAELKSNPNARLVLIGEVTVRGLVDLTARWLPKQAALPNERVLVSPALLREFDAARVAFPASSANQEPAQILHLQ